MHIHIDGVAGHVEEQQQAGAVAGMNRGAIPGLRRAHQKRVADRAAAHEHVGLTAGGLRLRRPLAESRHLYGPFAVGDRQQRVGHLTSPQRVHAIDGPFRRRRIEQHPAVAGEGERDVRPREGEQGQRLAHRARFGRGSAQELAPGGSIEKQPAHRDGGAALARGFLSRFDLPAGDAQAGRGAPVHRGLELEARDRRDRGERLAAEAEGVDADQVRRVADLAGGVPLQGEARVLRGHPFTVVAHADEGLTAVFQLHPHGARAGVERVLDQLLDDRRRPLDHLARGDLVGHRGRQDGDLRAHSVATSRARTHPRTPSGRATRTQAP